MNAPATQPTMNVGAFSIDILVQGFPGKTVCHGGLGWSTVALVRGEGKVILVDAGNFGMRRLVNERLAAHGLTPDDVTDVILTHAHFDHSFGNARFGPGSDLGAPIYAHERVPAHLDAYERPMLAELIAAGEEREQLAQLNLVAGRRAKASTAYTSALKYLVAGAALGRR